MQARDEEEGKADGPAAAAAAVGVWPSRASDAELQGRYYTERHSWCTDRFGEVICDRPGSRPRAKGRGEGPWILGATAGGSPGPLGVQGGM